MFVFYGHLLQFFFFFLLRDLEKKWGNEVILDLYIIAKTLVMLGEYNNNVFSVVII